MSNSFVFINDNNELQKINLNVVSFKNNLSFNNNFLIYGNTYIKNKLNVDNDLIISKNINIYGNTHIKNKFTIDNDLIVSKNLNIFGNTYIKNKLKVDNDVTFSKNLNIFGNTYIKTKLKVDNDLIVSKNLNIFGNTHIKNKFTVNNDVIFYKNLNINGNTHIKNKLTVNNDVIFYKNLNIFGNTNIIDKNGSINTPNKILTTDNNGRLLWNTQQTTLTHGNAINISNSTINIQINKPSTITNPANDDLFLLEQATDGSLKNITYSNLLAGVDITTATNLGTSASSAITLGSGGQTLTLGSVSMSCISAGKNLFSSNLSTGLGFHIQGYNSGGPSYASVFEVHNVSNGYPYLNLLMGNGFSINQYTGQNRNLIVDTNGKLNISNDMPQNLTAGVGIALNSSSIDINFSNLPTASQMFSNNQFMIYSDSDTTYKHITFQNVINSIDLSPAFNFGTASSFPLNIGNANNQTLTLQGSIINLNASNYIRNRSTVANGVGFQLDGYNSADSAYHTVLALDNTNISGEKPTLKIMDVNGNVNSASKTLTTDANGKLLWATPGGSSNLSTVFNFGTASSFPINIGNANNQTITLQGSIIYVNSSNYIRNRSSVSTGLAFCVEGYNSADSNYHQILSLDNTNISGHKPNLKIMDSTGATNTANKTLTTDANGKLLWVSSPPISIDSNNHVRISVNNSTKMTLFNNKLLTPSGTSSQYDIIHTIESTRLGHIGVPAPNSGADKRRQYAWGIENTAWSLRALGLLVNNNDMTDSHSTNWSIMGWFDPAKGNHNISFTASHLCYSNESSLYSDDMIGLIVEATGEYDSLPKSDLLNTTNINISNSVPIVKLTNTPSCKKIIGVIAGYEEEGKNREGMNFNNFIGVFEKDKNRLNVQGIGEGAVWVCNENGNFENGDYITSSSSHGYGMKQNDDILHNYTVAKITCDIDFSNIDSNKFQTRTINTNIICVFVGCIYYSG